MPDITPAQADALLALAELTDPCSHFQCKDGVLHKGEYRGWECPTCHGTGTVERWPGLRNCCSYCKGVDPSNVKSPYVRHGYGPCIYCQGPGWTLEADPARVVWALLSGFMAQGYQVSIYPDGPVGIMQRVPGGLKPIAFGGVPDTLDSLIAAAQAAGEG